MEVAYEIEHKSLDVKLRTGMEISDIYPDLMDRHFRWHHL